MEKVTFLILLVVFFVNYLAVSNNYITFAVWIERTCKPFDKGMLTTLPHPSCQHEHINVSNMLEQNVLPEVNSAQWFSLEDLKGEVWKEICGWEGRYSVSNYGRIKSHERIRELNRYGGKCLVKERIMKLTLHKNKGGYWYVSFHTKNGAPSIKKLVHVLVAKLFVPNPQGLPFVNHKDENSRNNIATNLEWCDCAYNNAYGTARERAQQTRIRKHIAKAVAKCDAEGNIIERFISLGSAGEAVGIDKATLSHYCHSNRIGRDGYYYKFI